MAAFDQQALAALLDKQRYEEIAPQLDEDDLKVCVHSEAIMPARVMSPCILSCDADGFHETHAGVPVQSATQDVLSERWPAVIHLLGHLYNGKL